MHASLKPLLELNAQRIKYRDQLNVRCLAVSASHARLSLLTEIACATCVQELEISSQDPDRLKGRNAHKTLKVPLAAFLAVLFAH